MKYVEVVTLFVFVMLVVSLFYGNSIWSFPWSIFAIALFMQNNCWSRLTYHLVYVACCVPLVCSVTVIEFLLLWFLVGVEFCHILNCFWMSIFRTWLLVCYFWSLSCLRLVGECIAVVCIVVLLVCCKKVGSMSIYFFILLHSVKRCMSSSTLWQWSQ